LGTETTGISGYRLRDSGTAQSIVLGIAGLIATVVAAYWPTWSPLWRPHGYFVSLLTLWLLYSARARLASAPIKPHGLALVPMIACGAGAVLAWRSGIPALQLLMLPLLILLAVVAAFGAAVARVVAISIGFLYFAAPLWNVILTSPLQHLTIATVRILAPAIGLPATFSGNLINLPGGITFEVTEGCSGAGFLVQGLAVAMLLGELEQAPVARRVRLLGSAAVVALLANWVRVLLIIELGYSSGLRSVLATRYHVGFGYALFVAVLAVYVWAATRRPLPLARPGTLFPPVMAWRPGVPYAAALVALIAVPVLMALTSAAADRAADSAGHASQRSLAGQLRSPDHCCTMTSIGTLPEPASQTPRFGSRVRLNRDDG
jgi:exosortase